MGGHMAISHLIDLLRPNQINREYFFQCIRYNFPQFTPGHTLIEAAYRIAKEAHRQDFRRSGERYFEHVRAVSLITTEYLRIRDADACAAGLVHDTPEDHPDQWPIERIADELNPSIAARVQWGNKRRFDAINDASEQERRYRTSLLLDAPRELAEWKLPDGLHNLLTLWDESPEAIERKITDALAWRLPLAEKHGLLVYEYEEAISNLIKGKHAMPPPKVPSRRR